MKENTNNAGIGNSVTVVGAGNIGLQVCVHLSRNPLVKRITIVDPDSFSSDNHSQFMSSGDVGKQKATVAATRIRRLRRDVEIIAITKRVENIPWGRLRAAVILGCVDNRLARSFINQIAWRVGSASIDAGIRASGSLCRVQVHVPGADSPCLECSWGARDLELLGQSFSCDGRLAEPAPTAAPSSLGGLAAALQVIECEQLLLGTIEHALKSRQVIVDARSHQHYVNLLRRNPKCAFDHDIWTIHRAPESVRSVSDLTEFGRELGEEVGGGLPAAISAERKSWVTRLVCPNCGQQARVLRLQGRIGRKRSACPRCGGEMRTPGFDLRPRIELRSASARLLNRPLRNFGLRGGDVLTLSGERGVQHIELTLGQKHGAS